MSNFVEVLSRDAIMRNLIEKFGELTLVDSGDYFVDLVISIVGQQLSGKAADTIYKRVMGLVDHNLTVDKVLEVPIASFRQAGLSQNKISYITNLAQAVKSKGINLETMQELDNGEVVRQLTALKGIGQWTAEMFLIFSLAREDIFSHGDSGLNGAICALYGKGHRLAKEQIIEITDRWKPYRSIASLYLWKSLDNKI